MKKSSIVKDSKGNLVVGKKGYIVSKPRGSSTPVSKPDRICTDSSGELLMDALAVSAASYSLYESSKFADKVEHTSEYVEEFINRYAMATQLVRSFATAVITEDILKVIWTMQSLVAGNENFEPAIGEAQTYATITKIRTTTLGVEIDDNNEGGEPMLKGLTNAEVLAIAGFTASEVDLVGDLRMIGPSAVCSLPNVDYANIAGTSPISGRTPVSFFAEEPNGSIPAVVYQDGTNVYPHLYILP